MGRRGFLRRHGRAAPQWIAGTTKRPRDLDQGEEAMPLATLRQVLDEAAKGGYGVGAFNVNNMEQVQGIVLAAQEVHAPVILQVSRGALSYAGNSYVRHLILAASESAPEIPIVLHLD